jgi:ribonuclease Z
MTPLIHPRLINDPFGDPGLFLEFKFQKRAMLFDLGDLGPLSPRTLLRVSDVFVSHGHMDHFSGFDRLLRICLGRDKDLRLYGPPGFIDKVEHKLRAYDWNLVQNYAADFTICAAELASNDVLRIDAFRSSTRFRREPRGARPVKDAILLEEEGFRVRAAVLDHDIPCLAFSIEEARHVNVWKNRIEEMGLGVGPWLREAKAAVLRGEPDDTEILASWRENGTPRQARCKLGALKERALTLVPGQKVAYVVDTLYTPANAEKIIALARDADVLFIEAMFLDADAARAGARYHLTAVQAGAIARRACVQRVVPFHFSPRYTEREEELRQEVESSFAGASAIRAGSTSRINPGRSKL